METPNLDRLVQLHEQIEIHYYVDNYEATLWTQDGCLCKHRACGGTIAEALILLDAKVDGLTLEELRNES